MYKLARFINCFLLVVMLVFILSVPVQGAEEETLSEVRDLLETFYVDPVPQDVLQAGSVEEMLELLGDPHTRYLPKEEFEDYVEYLNHEFSGVGIYMNMIDDGVEVVSVIKGSPAEKAGIKQGDVIISAGEKSLEGLTAEEAMNVLRGPDGSQVELAIKRNGEVISVDITRGEIEVPGVFSEMLSNNTGYIYIENFGSRTAEELGENIKNLKDKKADKWIIDLRGNPGGYVTSAVEAAGYFINGGNNVLTMKEKNRNLHYPALKPEERINAPIAVLVDKNSASAAEILSAALKDYGKAVILGTTTYGKGTVQQVFPLSNGDVVKITIARFYSPAGQVIDKKGVTPDINTGMDNIIPAAELLLAEPLGSNPDVKELVSFETEGYRFIIDPEIARMGLYWQAWGDILNAIKDEPVYHASAEEKRQQYTDADMEARWPLYYPGYGYLGEYEEVSPGTAITVYLSSGIDEKYINYSNIELVNAVSGERAEVQFETNSEHEFLVIPEKDLASGEYWLVIRDTLRFSGGQMLDTGLLAKVNIITCN